jgi:hypothetical protein
MCFATAAAVAGIVGSAVTATGVAESGAATANAANYSAQVAANNAVAARQNAQYAIESGNAQATATSLKNASTAGKITTGQAASGVDVNEGSAVNVQASERELGQLDTETILNNANLQAYGYRTQATGYQSQSELEAAEAQQAPIGADLAAGGTVLSGASGVANKWAGMSPNGPSLGPSVFGEGGWQPT